MLHIYAILLTPHEIVSLCTGLILLCGWRHIVNDPRHIVEEYSRSRRTGLREHSTQTTANTSTLGFPAGWPGSLDLERFLSNVTLGEEVQRAWHTFSCRQES